MTRTRRFTLAAVLAAMAVGVISAPAHAQSPLDGFNPGANNDVYAIAVQADGKILVGGTFTGLGGGTGATARQRIGRLNIDGTVDGTFNPGANATSSPWQCSQTERYWSPARSTTWLGTARNFIGRLNPDGTLDMTFNPGANSDVLAVVVQPDGKILVAGSFTQLGGGGTGTTPRNRIGRLNADGSLDTAFNPGADNTVNTLGLEPDGQIVVGGAFTMLGGGGTGTTTRNRLGRLHANGSLDSTFNPGANDVVRTSAVQSDGKILVGGDFTMLGGGGTGTTTRNRIGRLNADGSLDTTFNPGANDVVRTSTLQSDGGILVGGDFTMLGGGGTGTTARNRIGRLNPDGSLDTAFGPGANDSVFAVALQPDGKILVGGHFTLLTGADVATRNRIGRLQGDGSLDVDFNPGANNVVYTMTVQPDGKILVGGEFTMLGGGGTGTVVRNRIGRLNPDGTVDTPFNPGANGPVVDITVQPDGKILVSGIFTTWVAAGPARRRAATSHGSTKTGRSIRRSIQVRTASPGRWRSNRTARFCLAVTLRRWGAVGPARRRATSSGGSTPTARSTQPSIRARTATSMPWAYSPTGRSWSAASSRALGGGTGTTMRNRIGRLNPTGTVDITFNPGANNYVLNHRGAVRRKDCGWRRLHWAGRRDRHDDAQPDRPNQPRWHRSTPPSIREPITSSTR